MEEKDREGNKSPTVQGETVSELILYLDCHNSIGPVGIREQKKTAEVIDKPLSLIYYHTWSTGEVPDNWRLANPTAIYKKIWKEDLGNNRPVSLILVSGKVMEQIILKVIRQHTVDS